MLGLVAPKPEVTEYIPSGRRDLQFHSAPPLSHILYSALRNQRLIPLSGKFHIVPRCFPGSFFEGMEHIDRFLKLGNVADTVFHRGMNSDLTDPRPNARHRFPVRRLPSLLNQPKLKTREPLGIRWECLDITPRGPKPQNRLFCHDVNMQVLVYFCQGSIGLKSGSLRVSNEHYRSN